MKKKLLAVFVAVSILALFVPTGWTAAAEDASDFNRAEQSAELTFTDNGIAETQAGSGYAISGTALTVTAAGTYRVNGSCANGSITVGEALTGVTLILDNLSLTSSSTAPVVVKKLSRVSLHLEGKSTLTDNEDPNNESSSDATVADAFEGAAIKAKSGSTVTFCGDGDLTIVANAKNGVKGGATAALIFNQTGTITVTGSGRYYGGTVSGAAVNNGIACDGSIVFNQGSFVIKAANDGIKSAPDATDETAGTAIDTDSAGTITVNGGSFDIDVDGDGWYDGTDAYFVRLVVSGMISGSALTDAQRMAADCNHDGVIDSADAVLLEQAGLLLESVDQTLPGDELQSNSVYPEYCGLIDQSIEINGSDQPAAADTPAEETAQACASVWRIILDLFKRLVNFVTMMFSIVVLSK